jgi:DNA-binding XRE family transcriptional regulator
MRLLTEARMSFNFSPKSIISMASESEPKTFVALLNQAFKIASNFRPEVFLTKIEQPTHQHLYKCLGKVVSLQRKRLHMSQQELSEESGVDRVFISNIEQGKRKPSFGAVSNVAHGLKISYSRLVGKCEECMRKSA